MSFLVGLDLNDVQVQTDSGNASTTGFTLNVASTTNAVAAYISGVRQLAGTDYSVSGTTITFTTAPPTGTNNIMYVYTKAAILNTVADASVTTAKIAANAVDETKLKDALVADFTEVTVAAGDSILLGDVGDSGNTKRDTVQGILDLAGGGAWAFIEKITADASSNTVTFSHTVETGYDYSFIIRAGKMSGDGDGEGHNMLVGTGAGPTFQTSGYLNQRTSSAVTTLAASAYGTASILIGGAGGTIGGAGAGEAFWSETTLFNPGAAEPTVAFGTHYYYNSSAGDVANWNQSTYTASTAITGLQIICDATANTWASGDFLLFRRKLS
jgi:hypothetical protein